MSVTKRNLKDGSYKWEVRISHRDPVTGKRKPINVGQFRTKKEAEAAEAAAILKRDTGSLLEPDKTTVADLLDTWLADKAATVTSNTVADYRHVIDKHIKP